MSYWILKGKQPVEVGMLEWSQWHLNTDLSVASTMFEGVLISTIFLAKDFRIGTVGSPILFETMIFSLSKTWAEPLDNYYERYATWDEAVLGHEFWVKRVMDEFSRVHV